MSLRNVPEDAGATIVWGCIAVIVYFVLSVVAMLVWWLA